MFERDDTDPGTRSQLSPARPGDEEVVALADRPLAEHAEVYERLHRELSTALSSIDSA